MTETEALAEEPLWGPEEVSAYLKVPIPTLYMWRRAGTGPQPHKMGRHLRYFPADVRSWARGRAVL